MCAYVLVTQVWFGVYYDMNEMKSSGTFLLHFAIPHCGRKKTNMTVASMMTCKIGLIWRHMKTLYSYYQLVLVTDY